MENGSRVTRLIGRRTPDLDLARRGAPMREHVRMRVEKRRRWVEPWQAPSRYVVHRLGVPEFVLGGRATTGTLADLVLDVRGRARDTARAVHGDVGDLDVGEPIEEWNVVVPDLPTAEDLTASQRDTLDTLSGGYENHGRASMTAEKMARRDENADVVDAEGGFDALISERDIDCEHNERPYVADERARVARRRHALRELDVESDTTKLRYGNDVPGWIVTTPPTGEPPGRPTAKLSTHHLGRVRDEIGVSVERYDASWRSTSRKPRTDEQERERLDVAWRIVDWADDGDGRPTAVCDAYSISRKQLAALRHAVGR